MMIIRPEHVSDYAAIGELHACAFDNRSAEAVIVTLLRQRRAFDPELSLVAEINGRVIGHALFSPYQMRLLGQTIPAVNLAPIAVDPTYQGQSIGGQLITQGHTLAAAKGYTVSILLGHSSYYPRFGYHTHAFGSAQIVVSINEGSQGILDMHDPTNEDVAALNALWLHEESDVDMALEPGLDLLDWLSPHPAIQATVYRHNGEVVGDTIADTSELALALLAQMVVANKEEFRHLPASIAVYRAAHAQALGDVPNTVKYARRVLDLLPEDHLGHGAATALLGLASWANGDLEVAHKAFADGIASVRMAGNLSDAISGTIALADIRMAQGRLREAMHRYEHALQETIAQGEPVLRGTADLYVGMSEIHREYGALHVATQHLLKSNELGERTGFPPNRSRWCVVMARIREAQGDLEGALDLLSEAERMYRRDFFPNVRPVAALKTRVWVTQGRLGEALGWAREQGLEVSDDQSYLREFEHITLARVLLAQYKNNGADHSISKAMGFLERLLKAAVEGERMGSIIEILVLQALAHQTQGDIPAALVSLKRALTLAEPEGYVRMFVDEGPPMAVLLEEATKHGIAPNYVRQLLKATGLAEDRTSVKQVLIEPLSEREIEVLRLLRTNLNGPEIASKLIVSLNTMRTHTKNIYAKLGVNNRRAAVRRAEELNLF